MAAFKPQRMFRRYIAIALLISVAVGFGLGFLLAATNPAAVRWFDRHLGWRLQLPSTQQARHESDLITLHLRTDPLIGENTVILFGDSHVQGIPGYLLPGSVANYGISGETANSLSKRILRYASTTRARGIVLLTGRNDLMRGESTDDVVGAVVSTLNQLPSGIPIALVGIPPLASSRRESDGADPVNTRLSAQCDRMPRCRFVDVSALKDESGRLAPRHANADGIHLSPQGYAVLTDLVTRQLTTLAPRHSRP